MRPSPTTIKYLGILFSLYCVGMLCVLSLGMCGCNSPKTSESSTMTPRHDAPFDVLPPEHLRSLETSWELGR